MRIVRNSVYDYGRPFTLHGIHPVNSEYHRYKAFFILPFPTTGMGSSV